ncbi:MAG: 50S ribosomal protein L22 [Nanoarchaeota archaeon]|nr:50S ribosomal protein L22 [Nanoarchaeota archaeon]
MKTDMHSASVMGNNLSISTKHAIVISNYIRGKRLAWAKQKLNLVLSFKNAIPFTVHNKKIGHRKGHMGSGRYPINATKEVLSLLNSAEHNASDKGLDVESLYISSIIPNQAARPWHAGRQRRTKMKRTHLKIILEEKVNEKKSDKKEIAKESVIKKTTKKVEKKEVK